MHYKPMKMPIIDIGLAHPRAHRLDAIPELAGNPLHRSVVGTQFSPQRSDHPHRGGLLLRAILTRSRLPRRLFVRHDSILVSKVKSLHIFQGDSALLGQLGL
jgi:hypothetical protein